MSKERLEELKKMRLLYEVCFVDDYASAIDDVTADFDLLIKRVQELEGELTYYKMATESYLDMEQENERYRKTFKEIRDLWHESTDATDDTHLAYTMARRAVKALEESK